MRQEQSELLHKNQKTEAQQTQMKDQNFTKMIQLQRETQDLKLQIIKLNNKPLLFEESDVVSIDVRPEPKPGKLMTDQGADADDTILHEIEQLDSIITQKDSDIAALQGKIAAFEASGESQSSSNLKLQDLIQENNKEIRGLNTKLKTLQSQLQSKVSQIQVMELEQEQLHQEMERIRENEANMIEKIQNDDEQTDSIKEVR